MNKERRTSLSEVVVKLTAAQEILDDAKNRIEFCRDDEQDAYDNLPESLQEGEKGDAMQENIDALDEAFYNLDEMSDTIGETIEKIQEAIDR